jgi:acyl-CoA reductase-like NAD-dependent aldehyde dehydrogenase
VVLGIAPWNAPVILGVRAIATPLACGNTVVLKGSETVPATHGLIVEALQRGRAFPPGVVNFVTNAPADAARWWRRMIAHPRCGASTSPAPPAWAAHRQACAEHLKPVVLELGGKAPLVVLDDADLDEAP